MSADGGTEILEPDTVLTTPLITVPKVWVAMDIGCYECGEPSALLGIFADEASAMAILGAAHEEQQKDWHGQHSFELFEIERS